MSPGSQNRIRRILIGMDPGSDHRSLLNTAREIAETIDAELMGHFVEESSLLHISSLPFARSIVEGGTQTHALDFDQMEKAIKRQAKRFENAISVVGIETNLTCATRISSGDFLSEIQASASGHDLVLIQGTPSGFTISSMMTDIRTLSSNSSAIAICPGNLQVYRGPVIILDEGNNVELQAAFELAGSLSQSRKTSVIVLKLDKHSETEENYPDKNSVQQKNIQFVSLSNWDIEILADILRQYQPGYILGQLNGKLFHNDNLTRVILRGIKAPLILFP